MTTYHLVPSTLGPVLVAIRGGGICFAHFGDSEPLLLELLHETFFDDTLLPAHQDGSLDTTSIDELIGTLIRGEPLSPSSPWIAQTLHGTPFQKKVWSYLQSIPRGEVRSYQEVAQAIGHPYATRAVASACAKNDIALLIPCHRVIRSNGTLGGYKWGLQKKRALLESEQRARELDQRSPTKAIRSLATSETRIRQAVGNRSPQADLSKS